MSSTPPQPPIRASPADLQLIFQFAADQLQDLREAVHPIFHELRAEGMPTAIAVITVADGIAKTTKRALDHWLALRKGN